MASAFKALALPAEPLGLSSIKPSTPSHSKPISLSTSDNTNNSKSSSKTETDSSTKTVVSVNGVSKEEEDFPPLDVKNFVSYVQSVCN